MPDNGPSVSVPDELVEVAARTQCPGHWSQVRPLVAQAEVVENGPDNEPEWT